MKCLQKIESDFEALTTSTGAQDDKYNFLASSEISGIQLLTIIHLLLVIIAYEPSPNLKKLKSLKILPVKQTRKTRKSMVVGAK